MEHPTIKIGSYSKPRTKALADREAVVAQAIVIAQREHIMLLVKRDSLDRWQAWEKRASARGVLHPGDYEFLPTGRRAKKRRLAADGGVVYVADTNAGCGLCEVERVL